MDSQANLWRIFSGAYRNYFPQISVLAVLGFFSSILAGIGIGAVIPLLSFLFVKTGEEPAGLVKYASDFFYLLNIPFNLEYILGFIVVVFTARAAVLFVFNYVSAQVRADYKIRTARGLLKKLLNSQWKFYISRKSGFIQDVILRDVDTSSKLLEAFAQMILAFSSAAILLIFVAFISPTITAFSGIIGFFIIFFFRPLMRRIRQLGREGSAKSKAVTQYMIEHTLGMKTVKSAGEEDGVFDIGSRHLRDRQRIEVKRSVLASLSTVSIEPVSIFFIALVFGFSYYLPGFSFEVFAAAMILVQRIFVYLQSGQVSLHMINEAIPYALEVVTFEKELSSALEEKGGGKKFCFADELRFRDVSFSHGDSSLPLLAHINLVLKKGEMVGLIGPSGSGKTSVADLVMRLIRPEEGAIELDGIPAENFDLKEWRTNIGYVSQDVFLLNDTIEQNIRFYDEKMTKEDIIQAAKKANIYDFVSGLKEGFSTIVGDRGVLLSGGQRQRIALARVLARSPEILILDEATSALDNESEVLIQKAIESLKGKVTVLMIAHRLSTVSSVDKILVLDRGKIVEEGTPSELMAKADSYFHRMYHLKD